VNDAQAALETLQSRSARANYTREIKIQTGVNRKRQINLYDPDGTRVELMEAHTIDGRPAPSSTLAPPN
jgi:lactoylglutathione lyase